MQRSIVGKEKLSLLPMRDGCSRETTREGSSYELGGETAVPVDGSPHGTSPS